MQHPRLLQTGEPLQRFLKRYVQNAYFIEILLLAGCLSFEQDSTIKYICMLQLRIGNRLFLIGTTPKYTLPAQFFEEIFM